VTRMTELPDPGIIESLLAGLASRPDGGIVAQLPREVGRRDSRWAQLFEELPEVVASSADAEPGSESSVPRPTSDLAARVAALESEVAALRAELAALRQGGGT
jgi:uncharacterized protein YceH (UPF0502 family)